MVSADSQIFMIIDGSAMVHRAYHAMPAFTTSKGVPTGAVSGFFSMFLKLIAELKPQRVAVAFDRPKPNFRQALYVGYQAQRPKMESDLSDQFRAIIDILHKAKIAEYAVDGYEADDVIGTLSYKFEKRQGHETYIITGDRDMLQLADSNTKILMPIKGISEVKIMSPAEIKEKYGVEPKQIIDYKALTGDASDNYPGVPGIGPKTAANLIAEYGNFENIYKHVDDIAVKNKNLAAKLIDGAESGQLSYKLATILNDVPFSYDFSDCEFSKIDVEAFKKALFEYEFNSLPKRVDETFNLVREGLAVKKQNQMKLL